MIDTVDTFLYTNSSSNSTLHTRIIVICLQFPASILGLFLLQLSLLFSFCCMQLSSPCHGHYFHIQISPPCHGHYFIFSSCLLAMATIFIFSCSCFLLYLHPFLILPYRSVLEFVSDTQVDH